jgi:formate dehydrogenase major subunit
LFSDFNRRIRQPGGFHLPTPPRDLVWNTPTGRANFLVFEGVAEDPHVDNASVLRLATLRSHNQYNTTIYGLDDRYRGVFGGRMVVFMNEIDMKARGIAPDDLAEIESLADDGQKRVVRGFKVRPYSIPQGSIGAYYPETNPLLPLAHHDQKSKTPAAKSIPVLVRRQ